MQCKERVDLLEALCQSRTESKGIMDKQSDGLSLRERLTSSRTLTESGDQERAGWIGGGTIPAVMYPGLSRPGPPLPQRPIMPLQHSSESVRQISYRSPSANGPHPLYTPPPLNLPIPKTTSRTPSPDKRNRMLTTLRPAKDGNRSSKPPRKLTGKKADPPAASKAAGLAWDSKPRSSRAGFGQSLASQGSSSITVNSSHRNSLGESLMSKRHSSSTADDEGLYVKQNAWNRSHSPPGLLALTQLENTEAKDDDFLGLSELKLQNPEDNILLEPSIPVVHKPELKEVRKPQIVHKEPTRKKGPSDYLSYRNEYPASSDSSKILAEVKMKRLGEGSNSSLKYRQQLPQSKPRPSTNTSSPCSDSGNNKGEDVQESSESADEMTSSGRDRDFSTARKHRIKHINDQITEASNTPPSTDRDSLEGDPLSKDWHERLAYVKRHLPKGIDESAANQIFNEIVVHGDEVHWSDIAGLDAAKKALKEAVVYPFLRPDLFMGLREPARGMLLFGPPGTGKTMLARAVATESRSTFFAISASSLTSKWLGESEKLVRALFALAKALAPSIIFVDEIDSLLSSRGGSSEHESTRRIKTEFLIQWSDLQRAAAGKEQTEREKKDGDASRVLVLAATNLPWAIDEAARRRFVRRQYIPLPEDHVRGEQLKTLLGHQKHELKKQDLQVLVELTDGK